MTLVHTWCLILDLPLALQTLRLRHIVVNTTLDRAAHVFDFFLNASLYLFFGLFSESFLVSDPLLCVLIDSIAFHFAIIQLIEVNLLFFLRFLWNYYCFFLDLGLLDLLFLIHYGVEIGHVVVQSGHEVWLLWFFGLFDFLDLL